MLIEALGRLPAGVEKVMLRSDTAGYQRELLRYCAEGGDERFGVIEFAVGVDVTTEFRRAVSEVAEQDWQTLYRKVGEHRVDTGQQWADVNFVPNWIGHSKNSPEYRFIATRERRTASAGNGGADGASIPRDGAVQQRLVQGLRRGDQPEHCGR